MNKIKQHSCHKELHSKGLKATPARIGVLTALENTNKPLDVVSVSEHLKRHRVKANKVTIFRIMNTLSKNGLIVPVQLNEGKMRYEHVSKANHHHFLCDNCGSIEDIADCTIEILENELHLKKGLMIKRHSLEFFGLCSDCQKR